MKSVLMVTATARTAGAERVQDSIAAGVTDEFKVVRAPLRGGRADQPRWRDILFGSFDLIHSHLFLPGLLCGVRRLWDRRTVWIHTFHYADYAGQSWPGLRRQLDRWWVMARADAVTAVSPAAMNLVSSRADAECILNALAVNVESTHGPRPTNLIVVGTVAMLRPEKGLDDWIEAVKSLVLTHPHVVVRIAGDGPELERLRARAEGCSQIEFCGYQSQLGAFYQALDLYVQPSVSESFGLATLEAMAHGVPVIAAAVGNLPAVLGYGEFGVLVDRRANFDLALYSAVVEAFNNLPQLREAARRGWKYWRPKLEPGQMIDQYRQLYRRWLSPGVAMIAPIVTHSTGGIQRQLWLQSRELARRGYRVMVIQRFDPELQRNSQLRAKWSHVEFIMPIDCGQWFGVRARGAWFMVGALWLILKHRRRIDLLHAHQLYSPTMVGAVARRWLGLKLVVKVTASGYLGELRELRRLPFFAWRQRMFRAIDRVIVLNEEMRTEMHELGFTEEQIRFVPNGVEVPLTVAPRPQTRGVFRVFYCGRFSGEKSLGTLIEAVRLLRREGFSVEAHLAGGQATDFDVGAELQRAAADLGPAVVFHGVRDDLSDLWAMADAFVLPSVSEGLSNALLEAQAHGVPCVASDIPGNRIVIEDGVNGLLFPVGDAVALAARVKLLLRDRDLFGGQLNARLCQASVETVSQRFSAESIGLRLHQLYKELL